MKINPLLSMKGLIESKQKRVPFVSKVLSESSSSGLIFYKFSKGVITYFKYSSPSSFPSVSSGISRAPPPKLIY